jgi:predicted transglutaminase-like cysteine proteinase
MNHYYKIFFLIIANAAILLAPYSAQAQASYNSYFNMSESEFEDITPFSKWTGMLNRFQSQISVSDSECGTVRYHPCSIKDWRKLLETLQDESFDVKLDEINNWGNSHPYIIDQLNWGINDYWETPHEFMEISGDCEDYAISKYYSLRALGIPEDRLRIIIVQDLNLGGIIHAILGVYDDDDNLIILDNQIKQVIPALKIYHYRPIYGLNETNWWTYRPRM